ncbi:MAG TPA: hypothetical protein VHR47_00180, partial [Bacillota bacterium]|nr:hypothetical protein [Bacillota bacterium]
PYGIGHMGGEMAKRMVDAAQGYLQEVTARELRKAFRQQIYQENDLAKDSHHSLNGKKIPFIEGLSQSGGEVHANQYPSENGTH